MKKLSPDELLQEAQQAAKDFADELIKKQNLAKEGLVSAHIESLISKLIEHTYCVGVVHGLNTGRYIYDDQGDGLDKAIQGR